MITEQELSQFTGTEHYYKHWFGNYKYTDGVKYLGEKAQCYWLLDAIFSYRRTEPFQVWTLTVDESKKAWLTMKEDSNLPTLVSQTIEYTTFPLPQIDLWLIDGVLLLPSEY